MTPWTGTVNISEGAVFNVALELSAEGFQHYKNKETLRAELALAYAEAAFRAGCRVNFDTTNWQSVTWAPGSASTAVSSSTIVQPTMTEQVVQPTVQAPTVQPTVQMPVSPTVEAPVVPTPAVQTPVVPAAQPQAPLVQ